jgi:hypothetical protein
MEQIQLPPYKSSWHGKERDYYGMPIQRYVRERYIPAPGFHFVDKGDSVYHIPIDQDIPSGS